MQMCSVIRLNGKKKLQRVVEYKPQDCDNIEGSYDHPNGLATAAKEVGSQKTDHRGAHQQPRGLHLGACRQVEKHPRVRLLLRIAPWFGRLRGGAIDGPLWQG